MKLAAALIASLLSLGGTALAEPVAVSDGDRVTVDYEVPVVNEALREYARFEIRDYRVRYHNDRLEVTYKLPTHLTGSDSRVFFAGPRGESNPTVLVGDGRMECESTQCRVKYEGIDIDVPARNEFLRTVSRSANELSARVEVGDGFFRDPGGVILFRTPGRYAGLVCESLFSTR